MAIVTEIGSCAAILAGISTKIDGSLRVTLEVNPEDQQVIAELLKRFALNQKMLTVAFLGVQE